MTTFAIWTDEEEDLGFILFAKHDGDWPPAGNNDCVFSGAPYDPALLDDPRARFVSDHKGKENVAMISYTDTEMLVRIDLDTGWVFEIRSDANGNKWFATQGGTKIEGSGLFL